MGFQGVNHAPTGCRVGGEDGAGTGDQRIGLRMRALRRRLGLTQTEMGRMIGVTFQQIQKYEQGSNRMMASRLGELARCLRVPVCFFFHGAGAASAQEELCRRCEVFAVCDALTAAMPEEKRRRAAR